MLFDWDDANILHLARHDITPEEAEQVLLNGPVDLEAVQVGGELRLEQVGETKIGRVLVVISSDRGEAIRIVTGWDASKADRNFYFEQKANIQWRPE